MLPYRRELLLAAAIVVVEDNERTKGFDSLMASPSLFICTTVVLGILFDYSSAVDLAVNCSDMPQGWSQTIICPGTPAASSVCSPSTCHSCQDCQLKYPGALPLRQAVICSNATLLIASGTDCPVSQCSYCLGCDTTSLAYLDTGTPKGVAVCKGCNIADSIFWNYDSNFVGTLGICQVNLSCRSMPSDSATGFYTPILLEAPRCPPDVSGTPTLDSTDPEKGPVAGGTVIHLKGTRLLNAAKILIGGTQCDMVPFRPNNTDTSIACTTSQSDAHGNFNFSIQTAVPPVQMVNSDISFEFRPNPLVTLIRGALTIAAGGITVTFEGQNLGSSENTVLTVMVVCRGTKVGVSNFTEDCVSSEDETNLTCTTPDVTDVIEQHHCMQSSSALSMAAGNGSYSRYDFILGLLFDGYTQYANLPSLPQFQGQGYLQVYDNVQINRFTEDSSVKLFDTTDDSIIIIYGANMNRGAKIGDYLVWLGNGTQCIILTLLSNQLTCRPPTYAPPIDPNNFIIFNNQAVVSVVVSVGNMKVNIGYLAYQTHTPAWLNALLASPLLAAAVFVPIAVALRCVRLHRRQQQLRATEAFHKGITNPAMANSYQDNADTSITSSLDSFEEHDWQRKRQSVHLPIQLLEQLEPYAIPRLSVNLGTLLGQGQFGKFFEALVNEKTTVAAKVMKAGSHDAEAVAKFLEEAVLMKDLRHPNVLGLFGVVLEDEQPIVLVQLMERGDLRSALNKEAFGKGDLVNFCLQIAHGMVYLSSQKFVHRNLAAKNCLLNNSYVVKISDFGRSHKLDMKDYYSGQDQTKPLPVQWMAIESLSHGVFTVASDVWSYGVVMWEIMARGSTPYAEVSNYGIKRYLRTGRRLEHPTSAPEPLYDIMRKCWCLVPSKRPTFVDLISLIDIFSRGPQGSMLERYFTREISFDPYSYASCSEKKNCHGSEEYEQPYLELLPDTAL